MRPATNIQAFAAMAVVATVLAVLAVFRLGIGTTAEATHGSTPGQIDIVAVDANPAGNGPRVIGSVDDCVAVDPESTVDIDVVIDEVDPADNIAGVEFVFNYNPAFVSIVSIQDITGDLMSDDGSAVISFSSSTDSDSVDDPDSDPEGIDGSIRVASVDFGSVEANNGSGRAARLTLAMSSATGVSDIFLTDPNFTNGDLNPMPVIQTPGAQIASGVACPGSLPKTDIAVSDVIVAAPATAAAGSTFQVTADALVQNLGPDGPSSVDITTTLALPADCSTSSSNPVTVNDLTLPFGDSARVPDPDASWDVTCSSPSSHTFTVGLAASVDSAVAVDNTLGNNQASGQADTAIASDVDIEIVSLSLSAPADSLAGQPFDVEGLATIRNNGPLDTVVVFSDFDLGVPPQCAIGLVGHSDSAEFTIAASQTVTLDAEDIHWRVRCNQPGLHTLNITGSIFPNQLHVTDTNTANDNASASTATYTKIGACQEDPDPETNPFQDLGPTLLTLLSQLTAEGEPVPEEDQFPLNCEYDLFINDTGGPVDDCESSLIEDIPCDIQIDIGVDLVGGTPVGVPGTILNPIGVDFLPNAFTIADDLAVPNGAVAGEAAFFIRTDGGLTPNGGECTADVGFTPTLGVDGGIRGNVPDSNADAALVDPNLWPNDLNAEVALVEGSFDINPLVTELTLWNRTVIVLSIEGVLDLPLNVLVWRIDDLTLQSITQSRWVVLGFPGDAIGPDAPGSIGGDPDADDPTGGSVLIYCTPFSESITLYGEADGVARNTCTSVGDQVGWALLDPNAVDFTGDDGTRSGISPCSVDVDGDGLTATEEEYYGTNPLNTDSDADGHLDGADNCPATSNAGQGNYDGDFDGDACDPDIDGDGTTNNSDLCPLTAVGASADSNGCSRAQVDADGDTVCNAGAPSGGPEPGCTGSDQCPNTASGQAAASNGCAQYQVDLDGDGACDPGAPESPPICSGVDNCPDIANAGQEDTDSDGYGDACDGCPTTATGWPVPASDDDCDGFMSAWEILVGTDPNVSCGYEAEGELSLTWPADLSASNHINTTDVLAFKPVFGHDVPAVAARFDMFQDGTINTTDVLQMKLFFGHSCTP